MTGTAIEKTGERGLSAEALHAARLDAAGQSIADISRAVGCSERSISRWRGDKRYLKERDKHLDDLVKELKPAIHNARSKDIDAHNQGVAKLIELLDLVDSENRPVTSVQLQAAVELARLAKGMVDPGGQANGNVAAAGAHAMVTVKIDKDGTGEVIEYRETVHEEDA